jgi:hypothetical protein
MVNLGGESDTRAGGAGTEAQIITPGLYAKKEQSKFAAVVRERDEAGKPYLPVYYGSRIYFDLVDEATYASGFERLVRWAWDKPQFVKPALGQMPAFLREDENTVRLATAVPFRRAIDAIRNGRDHAYASTVEYLTFVKDHLESFRITGIEGDITEKFTSSIEAFMPYRNELIELFSTIATYKCDEPMINALHRFFESLLPYFRRPEHITHYTDLDFDNFKFIAHELFMHCLAVKLKHERFGAVSQIVNSEYFVGSLLGRRSRPMESFVVFRHYLRTLEAINSKLNPGRVSLHADLLKRRCEGTGVEFRHLMTADLCLYIRSRKPDISNQ